MKNYLVTLKDEADYTETLQKIEKLAEVVKTFRVFNTIVVRTSNTDPIFSLDEVEYIELERNNRAI